MLPNLIIAGSNKSGTSSVFTYLLEHPEVCGSRIKETSFFEREFTGEVSRDITAYAKYFSHCSGSPSVVMEASPGYLAGGREIAACAEDLLNSPRYMFIFRNPVDRVYSYYHFQIGQMSIPSNISFAEFINMSILFEKGKLSEKSITFESRHLNALRYGCYADYLQQYYEVIPRERIFLSFFDTLVETPVAYMKALSAFLGIDGAFYENYKFKIVNSTFSPRLEPLHRIALAANRRAESFLRARPFVKTTLSKIYKKLNSEKEGYDKIPPSIEKILREYYCESIEKLSKVEDVKLPSRWQS